MTVSGTIKRKRVEFEGDRFSIVSFEVRGEEKMAIVDKVTQELVSNFHDIIYSYGLPSGSSKYYLAVDDRMFYIYDKDNNIVDGPSAIIYPDGLVKGESIYYIKQNENGKLAIYDLHGKKISFEFDGIIRKGLVRGKGDYYTGVYEEESGEKIYVLASKNGDILTNGMKTIPDPETYQDGSNYVLTYARIPNESNPSVVYTMYYVMSTNGIEASEFYTKEKALKTLEAKRKIEKAGELQLKNDNEKTWHEISL